MRGELVEAKAELSEVIETHANKILKKPRKELTTSVRAIQGGQWESNRAKF